MLKKASSLILFLAIFTTLYSSDLDLKRLRQNIAKENNLSERNIVVSRSKDILNISILKCVKNCKLGQLKVLNARDKFYGSIIFSLPSGTFPRMSFAVIYPEDRLNKKTFKYDAVVVMQTKDEQIDISGLSSIKMSNFSLNLFDTSSLNKLESNQYVQYLYITYKKKNSFDCNILEKFPKLRNFHGRSINKFTNPESLKKYKIRSYFFYNCNDYIFLSTINTQSWVVVENMKIDGKLASKYLNQRNSTLNVAFNNCEISDIDAFKNSNNLSGLHVNGVRYKSGPAPKWAQALPGYPKSSGKSSGHRHDDPFDGVRPDIGKNLHEFGRSAIWNATHMSLGKTGFRAAAGPHKYTDKANQDWDHYSIEVERPKGKSSYVYFERDFRMDDIPKDLINKKVQDIVTFDEKSRVVTFNLGTRIEKYTLPKPRSKSATKK